MSSVVNDAVAARESARRPDGRFGAQPHEETSGGVSALLPGQAADVSRTRYLIEGIASVIRFHAWQAADGGEGACLIAAAAGAWSITRHYGVEPERVRAHQGTFRGMPHWWLTVEDDEHTTMLVDPTRTQFETTDDLLFDMSDDYVTENDFPPGWEREQVILEAQRAFFNRDAGEAWALGLLAELDDLAQDVSVYEVET